MSGPEQDEHAAVAARLRARAAALRSEAATLREKTAMLRKVEALGLEALARALAAAPGLIEVFVGHEDGAEQVWRELRRRL